MMETDRTMQEEILRLAKENNKMLHSMRRNAFWGGLFKFSLWAGLIAAPIWLYSAYLAPIVQDLQKTLNQTQGAGATTQEQLGGFEDTLRQLGTRVQSAFPAKQ